MMGVKLTALLVLSAVLADLSSCHDHMHRQFLKHDIAAMSLADPISNGGGGSGGGFGGGSSGGHGIKWQQKTSFQVTNGHQWTGNDRSDSFKATLNHDLVGGKNWNAGGYVTHERTNGFKDGFTHGGVRANINF